MFFNAREEKFSRLFSCGLKTWEGLGVRLHCDTVNFSTFAISLDGLIPQTVVNEFEMIIERLTIKPYPFLINCSLTSCECTPRET